MHVAGGDTGHAQALGELREELVSPPVVAPVGALELYAEAIGAEYAKQAAGDGGSGGMVTCLDPRGDGAAAGAARETDQAIGVRLKCGQTQGRLAVDRVLPAT